VTGPAVIQQLLRDAEECLQRAREGMNTGLDPVIVSQDLQDAGDSFVLAAREMALQARAGRNAVAVERATRSGR
jgi:thiazole synthase ThiGH ThiG subunit